jgi:hypothetical protein
MRTVLHLLWVVWCSHYPPPLTLRHDISWLLVWLRDLNWLDLTWPDLIWPDRNWLLIPSTGGLVPRGAGGGGRACMRRPGSQRGATGLSRLCARPPRQRAALAVCWPGTPARLASKGLRRLQQHAALAHRKRAEEQLGGAGRVDLGRRPDGPRRTRLQKRPSEFGHLTTCLDIDTSKGQFRPSRTLVILGQNAAVSDYQ